MILLLFVVYIAFLFPKVQNFVRHRVETLLSDFLNGEVTIGAAQINIFSGVQAQDLLLIDPLNKENFISVKNVYLTYQIFSLLKKTFLIKSIEGDEIFARISLSSLKIQSLPFLPLRKQQQPDTSGSGWKIRFDEIELDNFNVAFDDSSQNLFAQINDCSANMRIIQNASLSGNISVPRGNLKQKYWNGSFDNIQTDFLIDKYGIKFDSLLFSGSTTSLFASGTIPFSYSKKINVVTVFSSTLLPINTDSIMSSLGPHGFISGRSFFYGSILKPDWEIDFSIKKTALFKIPIRSISIDASVHNDSVLVGIDIDSSGVVGSMLFKAQMDSLFLGYKLERYRIDLHIKNFDSNSFQYLNKNLQKIPRGNLSLKSRMSGKNSWPPDIVNFTGTYFGKAFPQPILIHGQKAFSAFLANASWGSNSFITTGNINNPGSISGNITADINEPDFFSKHFFNETITGQASVNSAFKFTDNNLGLSATINGNSLKWNAITASSFLCKVSVLNNIISIDTIHTAMNGSFDSLVYRLTSRNTNGKLNIELYGSGLLKSPDLTLKIQGEKVSFDNTFFSDNLYGSINIKGFSAFSWNDITLLNNEHKIICSGTFFKDTELLLLSNLSFFHESGSKQHSSGYLTLDMSYRNDTINAGISAQKCSLDIVNSFFPNNEPFSGNLNAETELNGSLHNPDGFMEFDIKDITFRSISVKSIDGIIDLKDSLFTTNIAVLFHDSISLVFVNSKIPLSYQKKQALNDSSAIIPYVNIFSKNFNLAVLESFFPEIMITDGFVDLNAVLSNVNNSWNMNGEFSVHTDSIRHKLHNISANPVDLTGVLSGTLKSPQISFTLSTRNVHSDSEKIVSLYCRGIFKNDTVIIDTSNAIFDNDGFIQLSGFIPVQDLASFPVPQIKYSIRNVPLSFFNTLFPLIVIRSGTITGKGVFTNKGGKNSSYGKLFINNADFNFGQDSKYSGKINGEIRLNDDSLIIISLGGKLGDGDLTISGYSTFKLNKIPFVNFRILTKNSSISIPEFIEMNIDTLELSLKTVNNRFTFGGSAALGKTNFIRNIRINDIISKDIVQPDKPETSEPSLFELVDIEIELFFNENLFIDMNLGNLQLDGYAAISGPLFSPNLIGELRVIDGYIYYLDREFFVTNGIISNYDPQFNPSFDITGNTEVIAFSASDAQTQAYDITISVNGTLDKPTVDLESEPPLSKPDIIGVLTLGSTLGAIGSDLANRIGNLVGQEIIGLGTNKLERILNLQSINVSGNIFSAASGKGPEITLSRSFSKRLIFTYTTGFTNLLSPKISAVFRLFPNLFLTGTANDNGADIGLRFRTNK